MRGFIMQDRTSGIEAPATIVFSVFYALFCTGFVYQSKEFIGAGITPENLLSTRDWVGSEEMRFIIYHLRRTAGTIIIHSFLPFWYLYGYSYFTSVIDGNHGSMSEFWDHWPIFWYSLMLSIMLPLSTASMVWFWSLDGWRRHPFIRQLEIYANNNTWAEVAKDIEIEFRRIDKITVRTTPIEKVVVTDNWIILISSSPWRMRLSHQSDISLQLASCDHHQLSTEGEIGGSQYLKIEVKNRNPDIPSYFFRIISTEFQNLQDKVRVSINNFQNISIFKNVSERFVDVFKEQISENARAVFTDELEPCIGCMAVTANVTILRNCDSSIGDQREDNACVSCYCRPMWCVDCMGKWFASRQDQSNPETWLGSKCPCPTCRSRFCVLDVCLIDNIEP